jgi:hypothetical protein
MYAVEKNILLRLMYDVRCMMYDEMSNTSKLKPLDKQKKT